MPFSPLLSTIRFPSGPSSGRPAAVALVAVLQRPVRDRDPGVPFPVGLLRLVAGVGLRVVLRGRLPAVDQDLRWHGVIHPGPLRPVPRDDELVREVQP